ncbi:MAG: zinc ribbon domain-containing protein [Dehalococcoidia bacterium]
MPLYEYQCGRCGSEFELLRRMDVVDQPPCVSCGSTATTRKVSSFIVQGWTRARAKRPRDEVRSEPDEYELLPTDHSDEPDWADF